MKIMFTGGHITPALACIDELIKNYPDVKIVFVGRRYANAKERTYTFEYSEVIKRGVKFINLKTVRFNRFLGLFGVFNLFGFILGLLQAIKILRKERPDVILSFGGYLALPIALGGFIMKRTIYTHEQTIAPGLSNQIIGFVAKKIFIAFPQAKYEFDAHKTVLIGNPLRQSIFKINKKLPEEILPGYPVIYITGGSLGSHSINKHIEKILLTLLERYVIIHQAGNLKEFGDFKRLTQLKEVLPKSLYDRYILKSHIPDEEIGYVFNIADLVIGRSGANTVQELIALKKPAILIPLPWAARHEQEKQAKLCQRAGVVEIFNQDCPSEQLLELIDKMLSNIKSYQLNFEKLAYLDKPKATQDLLEEIFEK